MISRLSPLILLPISAILCVAIENDSKQVATLDNNNFSCEGKLGFYADTRLNCSIFYYCKENRRTIFACPPGSWFNQKRFSCESGDRTICRKSKQYYHLNKKLFNSQNTSEIKFLHRSKRQLETLYFPPSTLNTFVVRYYLPSEAASINEEDSFGSNGAVYLPEPYRVAVNPDSEGAVSVGQKKSPTYRKAETQYLQSQSTKKPSLPEEPKTESSINKAIAKQPSTTPAPVDRVINPSNAHRNNEASSYTSQTGQRSHPRKADSKVYFPNDQRSSPTYRNQAPVQRDYDYDEGSYRSSYPSYLYQRPSNTYAHNGDEYDDYFYQEKQPYPSTKDHRIQTHPDRYVYPQERPKYNSGYSEEDESPIYNYYPHIARPQRPESPRAPNYYKEPHDGYQSGNYKSKDSSNDNSEVPYRESHSSGPYTQQQRNPPPPSQYLDKNEKSYPAKDERPNKRPQYEEPSNQGYEPAHEKPREEERKPDYQDERSQTYSKYEHPRPVIDHPRDSGKPETEVSRHPDSELIQDDFRSQNSDKLIEAPRSSDPGFQTDSVPDKSEIDSRNPYSERLRPNVARYPNSQLHDSRAQDPDNLRYYPGRPGKENRYQNSEKPETEYPKNHDSDRTRIEDSTDLDSKSRLHNTNDQNEDSERPEIEYSRHQNYNKPVVESAKHEDSRLIPHDPQDRNRNLRYPVSEGPRTDYSKHQGSSYRTTTESSINQNFYSRPIPNTQNQEQVRYKNSERPRIEYPTNERPKVQDSRHQYQESTSPITNNFGGHNSGSRLPNPGIRDSPRIENPSSPYLEGKDSRTESPDQHKPVSTLNHENTRHIYSTGGSRLPNPGIRESPRIRNPGNPYLEGERSRTESPEQTRVENFNRPDSKLNYENTRDIYPTKHEDSESVPRETPGTGRVRDNVEEQNFHRPSVTYQNPQIQVNGEAQNKLPVSSNENRRDVVRRPYSTKVDNTRFTAPPVTHVETESNLQTDHQKSTVVVTERYPDFDGKPKKVIPFRSPPSGGERLRTSPNQNQQFRSENTYPNNEYRTTVYPTTLPVTSPTYQSSNEDTEENTPFFGKEKFGDRIKSSNSQNQQESVVTESYTTTELYKDEQFDNSKAVKEISKKPNVHTFTLPYIVYKSKVEPVRQAQPSQIVKPTLHRGREITEAPTQSSHYKPDTFHLQSTERSFQRNINGQGKGRPDVARTTEVESSLQGSGSKQQKIRPDVARTTEVESSLQGSGSKQQRVRPDVPRTTEIETGNKNVAPNIENPYGRKPYDLQYSEPLLPAPQEEGKDLAYVTIKPPVTFPSNQNLEPFTTQPTEDTTVGPIRVKKPKRRRRKHGRKRRPKKPQLNQDDVRNQTVTEYPELSQTLGTSPVDYEEKGTNIEYAEQYQPKQASVETMIYPLSQHSDARLLTEPITESPQTFGRKRQVDHQSTDELKEEERTTLPPPVETARQRRLRYQNRKRNFKQPRRPSLNTQSTINSDDSTEPSFKLRSGDDASFADSSATPIPVEIKSMNEKSRMRPLLFSFGKPKLKINRISTTTTLPTSTGI